MKKRILSLVFAVLLCVSLVPMNVIAEGLEPLDPGLMYGYNIYTQIDGEGYLSFSSDRGVFAGQMVNVYANGKLCFDGDGNPLYSYELRELQVTDANGNKVFMYKGISGPDSFIMPACDVTVKAVFRAPGDPTYTYAVVLEQDGVVDVTMTAGSTKTFFSLDDQTPRSRTLRSGDQAEPGELITVKCYTDLDHCIRSLIVRDANGNILTQDTPLGTFTTESERCFLMPDSDVTVSVVTTGRFDNNKSYNITTNVSGGYMILPSSAEALSRVKISWMGGDFSLGSEYELESLTVTDAYGADVYVYEYDNSFFMPYADVTVSAVIRRYGEFGDTYRVTLDPGTGTGTPITYEASYGKPSYKALNLDFYYNDINFGNNGAGFVLSNDYCPDTFTAPEGLVFAGWEGNGWFNTLTSTDTTFTAIWDIDWSSVPNASYTFSPDSFSFGGHGGAHELVLRAKDFASGKAWFDGGYHNVNSLTVTCYDSTVTGGLESDLYSIPFKLGANAAPGTTAVCTFNEDYPYRTINIYIDPADYAAAPEGTYTGRMKYEAAWNGQTTPVTGYIEMTLVVDSTVAGIQKANGGYIWMNGKRWRVIGEDNYRRLLISASGFDYSRTWASATNACDSVYSQFSPFEQASIQSVSKSVGSYGYCGQNALQNANVFLLSYGEAMNYFDSDADRKPGWWWTRTPGADTEHAQAVYEGNVRSAPADVGNYFGMRPAFVFDKVSVVFESASTNGKPEVDAGLVAFTAPTTAVDRKLTLLDSGRDEFTATLASASVIRGGAMTIEYSGAYVGTNECVSVMLCDANDTVLYYASTVSEGSGTWTLTIPQALAAGNYTLKVISEQRNDGGYTDYTSPAKTLTLTVSPSYVIDAAVGANGCGTVTGGGAFAANASVTLTATPDEHCRFVNWTENGAVVSTEAVYTFSAAADRSLTANFRPENCTVAVASNDTTLGTANGGGTVDYGASVTVNATVKQGGVFVNWTVDGEVVSTSPSYTFAAERNVTVTANFCTSLEMYGPIDGIEPASGGKVYVGGSLWRIIGQSDSRWVLLADTLSANLSLEDSFAYCNTVYNDFSALEQASVIHRTTSESRHRYLRSNGSYSFVDYTNLNDATLFILSVPEVEYYLPTISDRQPYGWWTRSLGMNSTTSAHPVRSSDGWTDTAYYAPNPMAAARPAFEFDRTGILYEVSAENGKAAADGTFAAYSAPGTSADRKLTLIDSSRSAFTASAGVTALRQYDSIALTYSGAGVGSNEYVSALLLDSDGTARYYASTPSAGSGTCTFALPDGIADGAYTLQVFSEQRNGGNATDYASPVTEIALTVKNVYNVTVTADPASDGTVGGGGEYDANVTVAVVAEPGIGYRFVNWTENGEVVSTDAEYFFTASAHRDLVAHFEQIYTVTLDPGTGTGRPVVYRTDETGVADNVQSAQNFGFYYGDNGKIYFRLDPDVCPGTFTAPESSRFNGWNYDSRYIRLHSTQIMFTAQWRVWVPIDIEIAGDASTISYRLFAAPDLQYNVPFSTTQDVIELTDNALPEGWDFGISITSNGAQSVNVSAKYIDHLNNNAPSIGLDSNRSFEGSDPEQFVVGNIGSGIFRVTVFVDQVIVHLDANGGRDEDGFDWAFYPFTPNVTSPLPADLFTRYGHALRGWNTEEDGSGVGYAPDEYLTLSGPLKLYAQWAQGPYSITADSGVNVRSVAGLVSETPFTEACEGDDVGFVVEFNEPGNYMVSSVSVRTALGRDVETFPDESVENGYRFTMPAEEVTIHAQVSEACDITFAPNGGEGDANTTKIVKGSALTLPKGDFWWRDGYFFAGWDVGDGAVHMPGESVTFNSDTTVNAVWNTSSAIYVGVAMADGELCLDLYVETFSGDAQDHSLMLSGNDMMVEYTLDNAVFEQVTVDGKTLYKYSVELTPLILVYGVGCTVYDLDVDGEQIMAAAGLFNFIADDTAAALAVSMENWETGTTQLQPTNGEFFFAPPSGAEFFVTYPGEAPVILYGDVNNDGVVSSKDATLIKQYVANFDDETYTSTVELSSTLADVNNDYMITSRDATLIMQYVANYDEDTGTSTIVLGPHD